VFNRQCPKCRSEIKGNGPYCTNCGARIIESENRCTNPRCRSFNFPQPNSCKFCSDCGCQLSAWEKKPPAKK